MAAAYPPDSKPTAMFECPVCMDDFKDPRTLVCGHHFCRVCLEGIAGIYKSLKCPTCRCETKLSPCQNVADLPRSVLVNELQRKITTLLEGAHMKTTRNCDHCGEKKVTAVSHCNRCEKNYCGDCEASHKKLSVFKSHITEAISNFVFCEIHLNEVITVFCEDCKTCLCVNCIMGEHSDHKMEEISLLAEGSRGRLGEFVRHGGISLDQAEVKEVSKQAQQVEKLRRQFRDSVSQLRGQFKEFEQKLDNLERDIETKLSAEIKNIKLYASDLNDIVISKASLLDYAKHLLEKSPEAELVMKEREFPTSPDGASVVTPYTTTLPEFEATFNSLCAGMEGLIDSCHITYKSHVLGKGHTISTRDVNPLAGLKETHSFSVGCRIWGLAADNQRQELIVRTTDTSSPIRVYDYNGHLQEKLGGDIEGLVGDENCARISIDTKRSLYLCPKKGFLVLLDRAGKAADRVKVGLEPFGISYSEEEDVYVVSDWRLHRVFVINATSRQIITEFGGRGSGNGKFDRPFNVHVGCVAGIDQPVIVVSHFGNHGIKVHGMNGDHIRSFGSKEQGDGQLHRPWGVTTDPSGRIIVCDIDNNRVVSFWSENNQDQWCCLLESKQLNGKEPRNVACDAQTRVLAIGFENGHIQLFK